MPHPTDNRGRKISNFPIDNAKFAAGFMEFISNGVNFKIAVTDVIAALGATGTLVQQGDVLGTPILNIQGSVNNIRNLETEPGITAEVSPQGGALLKNRSIPGSGISIVAVGQDLQFSAVDVPTSSKTIIVGDITDFPAPVAGVITLLTDREYFLINDISTTNRFVFSNKSVIKAGDALTITLTYTGVDSMFTSTVTNARITNIALDCPNGTLFDLSSGGGFNAILLFVLSCDKIVTVNALGALFMSTCVFANVITEGFEFSGANVIFFLNDIKLTMSGGTLFNLGTATFDTFMVTDATFELDGAITFISGATGSANINADRVGTVTNVRIGGTGPITPTSGITEDDAQWEFQENDLLKNTVRSALISVVDNATPTAISVGVGDLGNPIQVTATWTEQVASGYTTTATGEITRTGKKQQAIVAIQVTAIKAGGGTVDYKFYLALGGVVITDSATRVNLDSVENNFGLIWDLELADTNELSLFVEAQTGTDDVTVIDSRFRVS